MKNYLTLLYVEDDLNTREVLSDVLSLCVNKLFVAKDGKEALDIFKNNEIHFIISDFLMPNMNGNELCTAVKEINPDIYFVLLTAYNDTELLVNAINSGVNQFLIKPIQKNQLFTLIDDISNKLHQKFELDKACVYLHDIEKVANIFYWDCNLNTKKIVFPAESAELFDLPSELKNNLDYKTFSKMIADYDVERFLQIFEKRIFDSEIVDEVIVIRTQKQENRYVRIATSRLKSSACGDMYAIGLLQDISRYEEKRLEILKESRMDPMLKIDNKKFFVSELESLIKASNRYGYPIGIIFFDIDDFKHINDTYGHLAADKILVDFIEIIKNNIRESDYLGRWGGDEFVLATGHSSQEEDIKLSKKLLSIVKNHTWINDIKMTISIGIAFYLVGDSVESLINRADLKMYESKKSGKNQYSF